MMTSESAELDVTVAISTWNRSALLRLTLERMCEIRVPHGCRWELIVVNNNCSDDTDAVCCEFINRLPLRLLHEPLPGKSHACNRAIRESSGEFILWTDDDVQVDKDWLIALVDAFRSKKADWVFGVSSPRWEGTAPSWYSPKLANRFAALDYGSSEFIVEDERHAFYGLNLGGTRAAHLALGGFQTQLGPKGAEGAIGEDSDLFLRARVAGMRIAYVPSARVEHVIPRQRATKKYQRQMQRLTAKVHYGHLRQQFSEVPWLGGLPRFMFLMAGRDLYHFIRSSLRRDEPDSFDRELRLIRFSTWLKCAFDNGFHPSSH